MLKRFLLFAWDSHERCGGWTDFVNSFDTAEEAKLEYETLNNGKFKIFNDMCDIVDSHAGEKGVVLDYDSIKIESKLKPRFGHYSTDPCQVCGQHKNNQIEPRFDYTVCEDHQNTSPITVSNSIFKNRSI